MHDVNGLPAQAGRTKPSVQVALTQWVANSLIMLPQSVDPSEFLVNDIVDKCMLQGMTIIGQCKQVFIDQMHHDMLVPFSHHHDHYA